MSQGRVLITGRYGFTGRYVAQVLQAAGWDVWGIGSSAPPERDPNYLQVDLTDRAALDQAVAHIRPDAVMHLAAIAFVAHGTAEDFYHVNLIGTHLLLDSLATAGLGQDGVIVASSANIYGNAAIAPIRETATPAPVNDYAVSKLAMEHMCHLFKDRLPVVIARPFNYTGVGQNAQFLVPKIVSHFKNKAATIELGNLDVARDFSDVRDVAHCYLRLLQAAPRGETFNICSGRATALQTVIDLCCDITGHQIDVTVNPAFVRANEVKTLMGDASRIDLLLEDYSRRDLGQTLEWMLQ